MALLMATTKLMGEIIITMIVTTPAKINNYNNNDNHNHTANAIAGAVAVAAALDANYVGDDKEMINTFLTKSTYLNYLSCINRFGLPPAQSIETSTTNKVFLWNRFERDAHLICDPAPRN